MALDLGRDVGAVPGPVDLASSDGRQRAARDGAHLIRDAQDVLDRLLGVGAIDGRRGGPAAGARTLRAARWARSSGARDLRRGRARARRSPAARGRGRAGPARAARLRAGATPPGATRARAGPPRLSTRNAWPMSEAEPHPGGALDRRLGLRRRRRDPGRPEGVRALRRARDDGDHGAHRPEHGRGRVGHAGPAGDDRRPGPRGRRRHRRRRGQDRDARRRARRSRRSSRRSSWSATRRSSSTR